MTISSGDQEMRMKRKRNEEGSQDSVVLQTWPSVPCCPNGTVSLSTTYPIKSIV
jgi:hypothetical protein